MPERTEPTPDTGTPTTAQLLREAAESLTSRLDVIPALGLYFILARAARCLSAADPDSAASRAYAALPPTDEATSWRYARLLRDTADALDHADSVNALHREAAADYAAAQAARAELDHRDDVHLANESTAAHFDR